MLIFWQISNFGNPPQQTRRGRLCSSQLRAQSKDSQCLPTGKGPAKGNSGSEYCKLIIKCEKLVIYGSKSGVDSESDCEKLSDDEQQNLVKLNQWEKEKRSESEKQPVKVNVDSKSKN